MNRRLSLLMGAVLLCAASPPAQARDWIVSIGAKATTTPPYEGADRYVVRPSPTLSARPADRPYRFTPSDGGTSFALISSDHIEFGPMARFRLKRKNDKELTGLDEVKWAAEPGAFLDLWPTDWFRLHGELRHGVGGHHGLVADTGFDLVHTGVKVDWSVGGRTGWGDKEYLGEYFGVTPLEAARSPLINRAYTPGKGRRYAGVTVSGAYHYSDRIRIRADAGYQRLANKAGNSPIVAIAGSRDQYMASVGVTYSFNLGL